METVGELPRLLPLPEGLQELELDEHLLGQDGLHVRPLLQPPSEAPEGLEGEVGVEGLVPVLEGVDLPQAGAVGLPPGVLEVAVDLEGLLVRSPYNEFSVVPLREHVAGTARPIFKVLFLALLLQSTR